MEQEFSSGPPIKVVVSAEDEKIVKVLLTPSPKPGLHLVLNGASAALTQQTLSWLSTYCKGQQPDFQLPYQLEGMPLFTRQVLEKLSLMPFGTTCTYGAFAEERRYARAIGHACGLNPCPLFIPCHRVLGANGQLRGFAFGLEVKKRLLVFESSTVAKN